MWKGHFTYRYVDSEYHAIGYTKRPSREMAVLLRSNFRLSVKQRHTKHGRFEVK